MSGGAVRGLGILRLVLVLVVAAVALGGPVRAVTALGLVPATLLSLGLCVALVAACGPVVFTPPTLRGTLVAGAWIALSIVLLSSRAFGPLAAWVGSDAGVHVDVRDEFVRTNAAAYGGFVSLYGVTWWIEKVFRTDALWSFGWAFLGVAAAVATCLGWAQRAAVPEPRAGIVARLVTGALGVVLLVGLALPVLHYYALDGFLPQVWGVVPLLVLWRVDASELVWWRKLGLSLGAMVWARYAYGLVLGDLCVLVAVFAVLELVRALRSGPHRALRVLAALAFLGGALHAGRTFFGMLVDLVPKYGWFVRYDLGEVMVGIAVSTVAIGITCTRAPGLWRLLRVPLVIVAANTLALGVLRRAFPGEHYYLSKYDFHALVFLACMVAAVLANALRTATAPGVARSMLAALALVGTGVCVHGLQLMYPPYLERIGPKKPFAHLQPLDDVGAATRIRERLREEHASFGGYLVPYGPMFNFMNAMLGRLGGGYFTYEGVDNSPGHCVFWSPSGPGAWKPWDVPSWMRSTVESLRREPRTQCRTYRASWDATLARELCGTCY